VPMAKRRRPSETRTPAQILDDIGVSVQQAEYFASEVGSDRGERHLPSLVGLADAGYAVSSSLARLKNRATGFETWYAGKKAEWESDPLLVFFTRLREQRTHEGRPPRGHHKAEIRNLRLSTPDPTHRPPGATAYTVDMFGRAAWHVPGPNGVTRLVPAASSARADSWKASFVPNSLPESHLGQSLAGKSLAEVCDLYATYLRRLLVEASTMFGAAGPSPSLPI
jgi:hypothetical protein